MRQLAILSHRVQVSSWLWRWGGNRRLRWLWRVGRGDGWKGYWRRRGRRRWRAGTAASDGDAREDDADGDYMMGHNSWYLLAKFSLQTAQAVGPARRCPTRHETAPPSQAFQEECNKMAYSVAWTLYIWVV